MDQGLLKNTTHEAHNPQLPGHEDRGHEIMAVCITTTVIIGLLVPLRLIVRTTMVKWIGWDDCMIVLAAAASISLNSVAMATVTYGAGRHVFVLDPEDIKMGLKLNFITQLLNLIAILFVKLSICFFLARLARTTTYKRLTYGTAIFMTIYTIACEFTIALQCIPMKKIWDRAVEGNCFPIPTLLGLSYTYSAVNIMTDFFLVFLPIPMIAILKVPFRQKILLTLVLTLGLFAAVASVVKLRYTVDYGKTGDFLWDSVNLTIWSVVEINVGIFCACMPALKPLFRRFLEKTGLTSRSRDSKNSKSRSQSGNGDSNSHPLQTLTKNTASNGNGVRRGVGAGNSNCKQTSTKASRSNDSEESIFAKAGQELGIHIPENNQSVVSLEQDAMEGPSSTFGVFEPPPASNEWR